PCICNISNARRLLVLRRSWRRPSLRQGYWSRVATYGFFRRHCRLILIGMFDSPFVRRVAVSMNLLGVAFEHRNWSVGKDFELIRQLNPLGRVPILVQPDGETLIESTAILDLLDEYVGPERALLPRSGKGRREALRILAVATGAAEKGGTQVYETVFRPPEKRYRPWMERCHTQMHAALAEVNRLAQARAGEWLIGN